jgi:hypothetical protein
MVKEKQSSLIPVLTESLFDFVNLNDKLIGIIVIRFGYLLKEN